MTTPSPARLAILPRWAQDHIATLTTSRDHWKHRALAPIHRPDSPSPISLVPDDPAAILDPTTEPIPLPSSHIIFDFGKFRSGPRRRIEATVRGNRLILRTWVGELVIRPSASNSIFLSVQDHVRSHPTSSPADKE